MQGEATQAGIFRACPGESFAARLAPEQEEGGMPQLSRRQAWLAAPALMPVAALAQDTDAALEALVGLAAVAARMG